MLRTMCGKGMVWLFRLGSLAGVLAALLGVSRPSIAEQVRLTPKERGIVLSLSPLPPPPHSPTNPVSGNCRAIDFGRNLFWDSRLSRGIDRSCATCHVAEKGWVNNRTVTIAPGVIRNVPHLWNAAYGHWFFWDGRADSLWAQAAGPIEGAKELDLDRLSLAHRIADEPDLKAEYEALFGPLPNLADHAVFPSRGGPAADAEGRKAWQDMPQDRRDAVTTVLVNVAKTLAAFEETITSKNSDFDKFVQSMRAGDEAASSTLSASAQRGLKLFVGRGQCYHCHSGPNFSDGEFHDMLLSAADHRGAGDAGRQRGLELLDAGELRSDGRFSSAPDPQAIAELQATARGETTRGQFKTPSLRDVAQRRRFMHDGKFSTLQEVLAHYASLKTRARGNPRADPVLGSIELNRRDRQDLIAFLRSLTDTSRVETIWDDCTAGSP